MFSGHGNDYLNDGVALALFMIPFALILVLIVASLVDEPLKLRAARVRTPVGRDNGEA